MFDVKPITEENEQNITIYAAEIDINQSSVPYDPSVHAPSQKDFVVYADTINITGPLVNKDRNINFIARQIIFNEALNASIDTSGFDGHVDFPNLPAGGSGVSGGSGTGGGNVTIVADEILGPVKITAGGGAGQSGQSGAGGKDGEDGQPGEVSSNPYVCCTKQPTDGEPGTDGGSGGNGGNGGNSGSVSILVTVSKEMGPLLVYGSGGVAGDAGKLGHGGKGGSGGYAPCIYFCFGNRCCDKANNGKDGSDGKGGSAGSPGDNGTLTVNRGDIISGRTYPESSVYGNFSLSEFEEDFPLVVLTTMLRSANSFYLNLDIHKATQNEIMTVIKKYVAIVNLTNATASSKSPDDRQKAGINNEASSRLLQLQQGVDFYGNVYNYVPVLSLKEIEAFLSSNIPIANDIFTQLTAFENKEKAEKERIEALQDAIKQTQMKIQNYEDQLTQIFHQLDELRDTINYLHTQVQHQTLVVNQAEEDVKEAIARKTGFEIFETFVDAIETVVGIGEAVAGSIAGLNEMLKGVGDLTKAIDELSSFKDFLNNITQFFQSGSATFDSIKDNYNKIKGFIDGDYPDKAKILVDKEKMDALLSELVGELPAAEELKAQMDLFFDLLQTRNKRILDFDTQVIESVKVQAQIAHLNASIQLIQAELVGMKDPTTPIYVSFMQHSYQEISENLLKQLYDMHLAYNYWALADEPFCVPPVGEDGSIGFEVAFEQLSNSIQQQQEGISQTRQHIENREVNITRKDHDFSSLNTSHQLTFNVPFNHSSFADVYQVAVNKVKVDYPGYVPSNGTISVGLEMMGDVAVKNSSETSHYYVHRVRVAEYGYNYGEGKVTVDGNLAGDGYVGLSPFTTWNLNFTLPGDEFIDFDAIVCVRLTFEGFAYTIADNEMNTVDAEGKDKTRKHVRKSEL